MAQLTPTEILDAAPAGWRLLASALHARFTLPSYVQGAAFVADVAAAAERADHHPDVTLRYGVVEVRLISHDVGRVTRRDLALARTITELAAGHGVHAQPEQLLEVELALDTADLAALAPFWSVLLTGTPDAVHGDEVRDGSRRAPLLWFQRTDGHATPRQRFHLDVWVPHDVADARIAAAVAAGGRVVDASAAPSFTVLEDAEGNKACVCTCLDR